MQWDIPERFNITSVLVDAQVAAGRGERPAIYYEGQTVSYRQAQAMVNRAGNALAGLGVRMEERVLLLLPDGPEFIAAFLGAMKIGAVPIPANTMLKPQDYLYYLNDSRAAAVVVAEEFLALLPPREECPYLRHVLVAGRPGPGQLSFARCLEEASAELDAAPTSRDDAAFWLYSSGTTGKPKGTVHLHHDMVYSASWFAEDVLQVREDDVVFSVSKLFFSYGNVNSCFLPFLYGLPVVLHPYRPEPRRILETIASYRPTMLFSVPTNYAALLQEDLASYDLSSLRLAVSAGEALPPALYHNWRQRTGVELLDGIGSTEVGHIFICNHPGDVRPGSSGRPVRGYAIRLVDDEFNDVPVGEVGNLLVRGEGTAAYYWNKHQKTQETFHGPWVLTGDRFRRDEEGYYYFVGRRDDVIKVSGIWVSPVEVEAALLEHPAVLECAVIGAEDRDRLVKLAAFLVLKDGYRWEEALREELRRFTRERLAHYKCPRWFKCGEELPKTASGKIQRYRLREMVARAEITLD